VAKTPKNTKKANGLVLYNKILKQFTKINNELPEDRKLSLPERRLYIKEKIFKEFKGNNPKKIGVKGIREEVFKVLETIVPKEGCDVNYISPSIYSNVNWFELDDFIKEVLPKCIYIKLDAGEYGQTKIFNTLSYNYTKNGVKNIVDNIREFVNGNSGLDVSFTGEKKLRNRKANDGTPENYYIDFILVVDSEPIREIEPVIFKVPKEEKKKVTTVKNAILSRVKQLSLKKKRKSNARKSANKNLNEVKKISKRQKNAKSVNYQKKLALDLIKEYNKAIKQLDSALNKGNLTKEQYDKFYNELQNKITNAKREGGLI
jgi:hypothetical protein